MKLSSLKESAVSMPSRVFSTDAVNEVIDFFMTTIETKTKTLADDVVIQMMNDLFVVHYASRAKGDNVYALLYDDIRQASRLELMSTKNLCSAFTIKIDTKLVKPQKKKKDEIEEEKTDYNLFNVWFKSGNNRCCVDQFVFDPRLKSGLEEVVKYDMNKEVPQIVYNSWPGFHLEGAYEKLTEAQQQSSREAFDHVRNFIIKIICNRKPKRISYLFGLLSLMIREPWRKTGKMLILHGPQGSGKTFFMNCIIELFGCLGVLCPKGTSLTDRFAGHLFEDRLLACLDESRFDTDAAMDALKSYVTNDVMVVEQKFVNPVYKKNCLNFFLSSNDEDCLHFRAIGHERRVVFFEVSPKRKCDSEYFKELKMHFIKSYPYFFHHLMFLNDKFDFEDLEAIPESHVLTALKTNLMSTVDRFFHEAVLKGATIPVPQDADGNYQPDHESLVDPEKRSWRTEVNVRSLYQKYTESTPEKRLPVSLFLAQLKSMFMKHGKFDEGHNTEDAETWKLPYYSVCKAIDKEMLGGGVQIKRKIISTTSTSITRKTKKSKVITNDSNTPSISAFFQ